jgi:predicted ATP-dependent endonuclease of OLD family
MLLIVSVKEFYDSLKKVGEAVKDYLERNKKSIELSPGEKLILLLSFWSIHAEHSKLNPTDIEFAENRIKILLLDEPDAHMHPKLIKNLMKILQKGDLNYRGYQVFLTTHNPITVSQSQKDKLFELKDGSENNFIQKVSSHRNLLLSLTDELVSVDTIKLIKSVYVEGEKDMMFYDIIFNKLLKFEMLIKKQKLNYISFL